VPCADLRGRFGVGGEVDVVSGAACEAVGEDALDGAGACAVEQLRRRLRGRKLQIDFDRVALVRADLQARFVDGEPLLVTAGDHEVEFLAGNREPLPPRPFDEGVDCDPAARFERQAEFVRGVPQVQ
jgi:hypothetical protein